MPTELLGTCIALLQVDKANKAQEVAEKAQNDFIIAKAVGWVIVCTSQTFWPRFGALHDVFDRHGIHSSETLSTCSSPYRAFKL